MGESLTLEHKQFLLRFARKTIENYLKDGSTIKAPRADRILTEKRGAFVTVRVGGVLRGCIGYPLPHKPLVETIIDVAVMAVSQDYRFTPLDIEELDRTEIEISVLSLPRPIQNVKEIEVGRHGIIVSKGYHKGLLLPQVPEEHGWDRETYLRHGCLKAGLDENEWKKGAHIEIFTADVFSEKSLSARSSPDGNS
ncbi:MAG: AmmeMemoRadiSam system protein A [Acidobacteriota bacterium]|nr:AmmeMemoRadiSam system protein A [Acidobacteriota bacterium]